MITFKKQPTPKEPAWPTPATPAELIPLATITPELSGHPTVDALAQRLGDIVVLDHIGRRCVTVDDARDLLDNDRSQHTDQVAAARRARLLRINTRWDQRRGQTVEELQRQIDALMADQEIPESLQAMFVTSLMNRIQRLEEGEPEPDTLGGSGVAFLGCTDDSLGAILRADRRAQREARWGRRRP